MHLLTSEIINEYCEQHSTPENAVLRELNRQTHLQTELPVMLSGHLQGRILSMMSHMLRPTYILEIGTFTGYSAMCLAEGLQENGKLISIDTNEETTEMATHYIAKNNMQHKIELHIGKAIDIIPTLNYEFDLVFIDADKPGYSNYFNNVIDKVRKGGFILADNVLFHGDVVNEKPGKNALAMQDYNKKMTADNRLENVLLPIRDGIMVSRKK
jgi:predicted O-methyltransferase YrrM